MSGTAGRWLVIAAGVAVAAAVAGAIMAIGTPAHQRLVRQDERRVRDLDNLKDEIEASARRTKALPASLSALAAPGVRLRASDPFTSQPYGYEAIDARRYRLCAVFDTDTAESDGRWIERHWRHPRGRYCFELALPDKPVEAEVAEAVAAAKAAMDEGP